MGKWDGYHDIDQDEDEDMEYYADVHGYEDEEPESVELTDAEVIARLKDALEAANARIAELEAQLAKPATIHEVIDDFGETVTAVTL